MALPYWVVPAGAFAAHVGVAALLVALLRRNLAARAFAAVLVGRGTAALALGMTGHESAFVRLNAAVWMTVAALAGALASVWFLSVFPRPRRPWCARPAWPLALGAVVAAFAGLVVVRPDLWIAYDATGTFHPSRIRALFTFAVASAMLVAGVIALVLAAGAWREPRESQRSVALVAAASGFSATATAAAFVANGLVEGFGGSPWTVVRRVAALAAGGLALAAVAVFAARARRSGEDAWAFRAYLAVVVAGTGFGALRWSVATFTFEDATDVLMRILAAVVSLGIVVWALLRHRLFDLDLKVKWTISRGTLAGAFVAVFFVVAQVAQEFLTDSFGWALGGIAAGALVFALGPLQRMASRVADAALPGVADTPEWRASRKAEVFRQAVRMARADGTVTRDEERHLAELAAELGLDAAKAFQLREDVEREGGTPI